MKKILLLCFLLAGCSGVDKLNFQLQMDTIFEKQGDIRMYHGFSEGEASYFFVNAGKLYCLVDVAFDDKSRRYYSLAPETETPFVYYNDNIRNPTRWGIDCNESSNYLKTAEALKRAELGEAWWQVTLGNIYATANGIDKNYDLAFYWYQEAAFQGDSTGLLNVGVCYANGFGVTKDPRKSFIFYQKSAAKDNGFAQLYLSRAYFYGNGVIKNSDKANYWLLKARNQANDELQKEILIFEKDYNK